MHNCSIRVNDLRGYLVICKWQDHIKFALEAATTEDRGTDELNPWHVETKHTDQDCVFNEQVDFRNLSLSGQIIRTV